MIDKYDVLRYAETLSEEDLQLLREQLTLIQNVKYPLVYKHGFISEVPESEKHTSNKSVEDRMKYFKDYLEKGMKKQVRNIPPYKPEPLRSVSDGEPRPPFVPPPPIMVWKDCICGSWWKVVHRKDCKCGGGRFVPEGEL